MAGCSGTPLAKKLGIVPAGTGAFRVLVLHEPPEFQAALGPLPESVERTSSFAGRAPFDVAVVFVMRRAQLAPAFERVTARMTKEGGVWIAWPKKSSGITADAGEQVLRDVLLPTGWVDNKVCAIDERWSGLRFVLRKELRKELRGGTTRSRRPDTSRASAQRPAPRRP